jgi:hypothetical protein
MTISFLHLYVIGLKFIDVTLVDFDERGGDSSVEVLSNVTDMTFGEGAIH